MKPVLMAILCMGWVGLSCNSNEKQKNIARGDSTFTITGEIAGLDSGWVYLMNRDGEAMTDSAMIINGNFVFRGRVYEPRMYLFGVPNNGNRDFRLGFYVENGQMHISGKRDSLSTAQVTGSHTQDEYLKYMDARAGLDEESTRLGKLYNAAQAKKNKMSGDSLDRLFREYQKKDREFVRQYARRHPGSYISGMAVFEKFSDDFEPAELESIYRGLDSSIRQSYYGKKIAAALAVARKTAPGQPAPDFVQRDLSGSPVALSSFRGKYLLLNFWASWRGPSRIEHPAIARLYQKYRPKGFEVLGVSLDTNRVKWLAAVKKDNAGWTQVSDLRGWGNGAAVLYGVWSVPMHFLIDREGKIIGRGMTIAEIQKVLKETLK